MIKAGGMPSPNVWESVGDSPVIYIFWLLVILWAMWYGIRSDKRGDKVWYRGKRVGRYKVVVHWSDDTPETPRPPDVRYYSFKSTAMLDYHLLQEGLGSAFKN